eukprot:scaffold658395_cov45-Prasinocladus_malaysianus.AAC.1
MDVRCVMMLLMMKTDTNGRWTDEEEHGRKEEHAAESKGVKGYNERGEREEEEGEEEDEGGRRGRRRK